LLLDISIYKTHTVVVDHPGAGTMKMHRRSRIGVYPRRISSIEIAHYKQGRYIYFLSLLLLLFSFPLTSFAGSVQLPQTGQKTCYNSSGTVIACTGRGQDGDIQVGVPWHDLPFTVNGNGTANTDRAAKLSVEDVSPDVYSMKGCAGSITEEPCVENLQARVL